MQTKKMVSFLAPVTLTDDVDKLVEKGVFTHQSDAWRTICRKGIEQIKIERGIKSEKETG